MKTRYLKTLMAGTAIAVAFAAAPTSAFADDDVKAELAALKAKVAELEKKLEATDEKAEKAGNAGGGLKIKWEPAPSISSADGRFEMNIRGRLQADAGFLGNDVTSDVKTTEFRRARLGIEGKAWNNVKYKFEVDFADNDVAITDAYIQIKGGGIKWTFGQQKTPNSLDEITSSRYTNVMERGAFTDAFGLARQLGVTAAVGGDNWTLTIGAFRGDAGGASDMDLGSTFAGRFTFSPTLGNSDTVIHLGSSFRYRKVGDDQSSLRFRQRPFIHATSKRFVNTGRIARNDVFFGAEFAVVHGRFAVQSEYAWNMAELNASFNASERAQFHGGYAEFSVFLTDDKLAYDPAKGAFGRVKPSNSLFNGGTGAVLFVYRYDMIDLSDSSIALNGGGSFSINGGEQRTHIVGLTWIWNNYVRWLFNYSHSNVRDSLRDALSAGYVTASGTNSIDTFSVRAQVDW